MKELPAVEQKFVLHWGEMGTRWGINRTVAQIHALLYISPKPLHAEEIAETLGVARSNVSTSLKELQGWGIVKLTHVLGDKRDHFEALKDVWEMFRIVLDERKRREIDPTVALLRECAAQARPGSHAADRPWPQPALVEMEPGAQAAGVTRPKARCEWPPLAGSLSTLSPLAAGASRREHSVGPGSGFPSRRPGI